VLLEPKGSEAGYSALAPTAVTTDIDGIVVRVGALSDLIASKELLGREKDLEHLPLLIERLAELERELGHDIDSGRQGPERGPDQGYEIGY
jgi:hypothetical protein